MRRAQILRRPFLLAFVGLLAALVIGVSLGRTGRDPAPAPPAVLNHIADRNEDAAINAAAHFKAEAAATTHAADQRANQIAPAAAATPAAGANSQ